MYIFLVNVEFSKENGNLHVQGEESGDFFPLNDFMPLQSCTFMGFTVPCPAKPLSVLKTLYGDLKPDKYCVNGKWKKKR